MPIVQGSRVVVVSGECGVGRHGRVKWLKHAGPDKWQRGALDGKATRDRDTNANCGWPRASQSQTCKGLTRFDQG